MSTQSYINYIASNQMAIQELTAKLPYDDDFIARKTYFYALRRAIEGRRARFETHNQMLIDAEAAVVGAITSSYLSLRDIQNRERALLDAKTRINVKMILVEEQSYCEIYDQIRRAMEDELDRLKGRHSRNQSRPTFDEIFFEDTDPDAGEEEQPAADISDDLSTFKDTNHCDECRMPPLPECIEEMSSGGHTFTDSDEEPPLCLGLFGNPWFYDLPSDVLSDESEPSLLNEIRSSSVINYDERPEAGRSYLLMQQHSRRSNDSAGLSIRSLCTSRQSEHHLRSKESIGNGPFSCKTKPDDSPMICPLTFTLSPPPFTDMLQF